jgi:hypothetical protein
VQYKADASQKCTVPAVTGEPPAITVAVRVIMLPIPIDEVGLPDDVTATDVDVGD